MRRVALRVTTDPSLPPRIITDRDALPQGADPTACDPAKQTWCGGTWNTIRENLDYIQDAGFTASASRRALCAAPCPHR